MKVRRLEKQEGKITATDSSNVLTLSPSYLL